MAGGSPDRDDQDFPYWLIGIALLLGTLGFAILSDDEVYRPMAALIVRGLWITVWVTLVSFALACALGLLLAMMVRAGNVVVRQVARFYIELVRGVPVLILLLYVGFVAVPAFVGLWNQVFAGAIEAGRMTMWQVRDVPLTWRAVIALALCYAAFVAEEFRAGLDAVAEGQHEAAQALGLTRWQTFRLVVLPQAIPVSLPPLGNSFINMIKDSALVSVLGVADITFEGRAAASRNFRFFEAFNITAFIYLTLTIGLALALRRLERRFRPPGR
jgi:polar amino acid transport system permease protein